MPAQKLAGLTTKEAQQRLLKYGPNKLPEEKPPSDWRLLLDQIKNPLIYTLIAAALITLFFRDLVDFTVITLAITINTVLGFYQERKAQQSLLALKKILSPRARVIRDATVKTIDATQLVPGDVVLLNSGEKIPADGRLVETIELHTNEAILTGESDAVDKKKDGPVFMGTVVVAGHGTMLVTKTGEETEIGKIAESLKTTIEEKTPLQKRLANLSQIIAAAVGIVSLTIFVIGSWQGQPFIQMFVTSVAIAVAAIPEGLVISLTVILSLGMQRLLKRKALVRKLVVAETLGSTTVIAIDKTGTLTEGRMRVTRWKLTDRQKALTAAVVCNNLSDPTETALWEKVQASNHFDPQLAVEQNPRLSEVPFSPEKKFMAVTTKEAVWAKGAPEVILNWCQLSPQEKREWERLIESWGREGLRLLALGYKPADGGSDSFVFLGLVGLADPVRPYVKEALKLCQQAGIKVKVITGDYRATAEKVLQQLGFRLKPENIMEGRQLDSLSQEELEKRVGEIILFARTTPNQKLKIVEALQARDEVVAMMGDGVNDAPALKKAEIGIVVAEASEVAKETADMVLLDSNFGTIVHAIEEGRQMFENIKKIIVYLLSDSFTEVILIGGSILLGLPLPVLPAQILWVNLIEDSLPGMALAFDEEKEDVMKEPPRPKSAPIVDREMKIIIFAVGLVTDVLHLGLFYYLLGTPRDIEHIRTIMFAALAFDSLVYVFSCKSLHRNLWEEALLANKFLLFSVALGLALLLLSIHLPPLQVLLETQLLTPTEWLLVLSLGLVDVVGIEAVKKIFARAHLQTIKNSDMIAS